MARSLTTRSTNPKIMDDNIKILDEELSSVSDVVDYGNNTNGYYLKFASGALICWKSVAYTGSVNTQAGALYESSNVELGNFPVAFIEEPVISVDIVGLGFTEGARNATATSAGITNILRTSSIANYSANVKVLAIGKWK